MLPIQLLLFICSEPVLKGKKAREREAKWLKMLVEWEVWIDKNPAKVSHYSLAVYYFIHCSFFYAKDEGQIKACFDYISF